MKIEQLLKSINEAGPRTAAQQASMQAAMNGEPDPTDNTIQFPKQPAANFGGGQTQGTVAPKVNYSFNASPKPTTTPTPQPSTAKKAWDYANSQQSGADIQKFGQGVADAGGSLSRGVQNVAQGTGNLVKGVGQGVASAIKGVGNVGAAATGALGQMAGGFKSGYDKQTGRGGSSYSAPSSSAATNAPQADQSDEIAQLRSQLQAMQQKLTRAGISQ
jgi:hypothetical protein